MGTLFRMFRAELVKVVSMIEAAHDIGMPYDDTVYCNVHC